MGREPLAEARLWGGHFVLTAGISCRRGALFWTRSASSASFVSGARAIWRPVLSNKPMAHEFHEITCLIMQLCFVDLACLSRETGGHYIYIAT